MKLDFKPINIDGSIKKYKQLDLLNFLYINSQIQSILSIYCPEEIILTLLILSFENNIVNVQRASGDEQMRLTSELKWDERYISDNGIIIEPKLSLRADHLRTFDESEDQFTNFSRVVPNLSTSISWPFFDNAPYGKQIIEPRIAIGYVGDEETHSDLLNEDAQTFNFNSLNLDE